MVAKGEEGRRGGREMGWEFGLGRCKLLYLEWINNKALMYSTGNYTQYPVINHNGKEYKKRMYIYIFESLCCTAKVTHRKSTILQLKK